MLVYARCAIVQTMVIVPSIWKFDVFDMSSPEDSNHILKIKRTNIDANKMSQKIYSYFYCIQNYKFRFAWAILSCVCLLAVLKFWCCWIIYYFDYPGHLSFTHAISIPALHHGLGLENRNSSLPLKISMH